MCKDNFKNFRGKIIESILATDMSHHFEMVDKIVTRVSQDKHGEAPLVKGREWGKNATEERRTDSTLSVASDSTLLCRAFLHMADIGHCARPFDVHQHLVVMLEKEFFGQGDRERELGLTVMPMMDRRKDSCAAGQGFFLSKLCLPLLVPYTYFLNSERRDVLTGHVADNIKQWADLVSKHGRRTAKSIVNIETEATVAELKRIAEEEEGDDD